MRANTYLQLNDRNGGLIANLSESGFSFRAAKTLESDQFFVRFQLPGSSHFIETTAWIVWKSASGKKAGARFEALPAEARSQIAEWIGSQVSPENHLDQPEKSSSDAEIPVISLLAPDSVPIPVYISPLTGKAIPAPASKPSLKPAATRGTASTNPMPTGADAVPSVPAVAKPAIPSNGKLPASVSLHGSATALPSPPNAGPLKLELPPAPSPHIPPETRNRVAGPLSLPTTPVVRPDPALPPAYSESSWYMAPKKSSGFWKIAALMILIGGSCFGAGVLFYRNWRIPSLSPGSAIQTSVVASASQPRESEHSANYPISNAASTPPAMPQVDRGSTDVIRDAPKHPGDEQFVDQPRAKQFVDQLRSDHRTPDRTLEGLEDRSLSANALAPRGSTATRANAGSPGPAAERDIVTANQENAPTPAPVAPGNPSVPGATVPPNQRPQAAAVSATRLQQTSPATNPPASNSSAVPVASSPAVSSLLTVPPVQSQVGSVSFFSRFRAIRNPGDSSTSTAGVLQIGPLLSSALPVYPIDAQRQQIQGPVELDVFVGSEGNVQSVHLVKGLAELAAPAMNAVRAWHYGQTMLGGRPVETEQSIFFTFKLGN